MGVVRTPPSQSPEQRLLTIAEAFEDWIAGLAPTAVSIERVFAQDNLQSVTTTMRSSDGCGDGRRRSGWPGGRLAHPQ